MPNWNVNKKIRLLENPVLIQSMTPEWLGKKIEVKFYDTMRKALGFRWFSVGICKYKPGYKSHDLLYIRMLSLQCIGGKFICKKYPLQDLLSSLNAVIISTNERNWILAGHVIFKLRYNQIYQLKTTLDAQLWNSNLEWTLLYLLAF